MYFLLKIVIFYPAVLVYRRVPLQKTKMEPEITVLKRKIIFQTLVPCYFSTVRYSSIVAQEGPLPPIHGVVSYYSKLLSLSMVL